MSADPDHNESGLDTPLLSADKQELLWAILESLSEGVVACDASGTLSFFNRATREFHGVAEEPIGAEQWSERYALHRADGTPMPPEEVPLARALRGEIVRDAVMVIAPRDLDARTVICNGRRLHDGTGSLLGAVVVMRDITEQIAAQRQKDDLAQERALNHAKDEFLATVAHELRNPLTSIYGWTQMLQLQLKDPEAQSALAAIAESTRMQSLLIEDLSDVGRISSGKLVLNRQRLLVNEILEAAVTGARPSAEEKGIALIAPRNFGPTHVEADRVRLHQVFWNLLTNAMKFTPRGGTVAVDARVASDHLQIDVRDSGRGIREEFLSRVFDRYTQDFPEDREYQGLGLGLSIARTIVELHGGTIAVTSDGEGKGANFRVTLPLATEG